MPSRSSTSISAARTNGLALRAYTPIESRWRRRADLGIAEPGRLREALLLRRDVWPRDDPPSGSPTPARRANCLPDGEEVARFLESVSSVKARVALTTAVHIISLIRGSTRQVADINRNPGRLRSEIDGGHP
jgi:hypothetical protein